MRALLINPKTPLSFWSFPEQAIFSGRKALCPPLGLLTVAAMLPTDWDLRLVNLDAQNLTEADWNWTDLVMLSANIVQRESFLDLIAESKQRGKTVVVGGPYPTSVPDEAIKAGCDFLVRGEGENTIDLFLTALRQGQTNGVFEREDKPDITLSPIPRFDLVNCDDYLAISVQTSRGCPFDCEFCDVVNLYGRIPRCKTPDQVLAELEVIYRLGWRRDVFISDDNLIGNKAHAKTLLAKLLPWNKSLGEPFCFTAQASVNLGQDLEMIDLMTEANFSNVFIGIESTDEDILFSAGKFQNIRNPLAESLNNINRNGLSVWASFIIGFDGEKKGAGERISSFVEQTGVPVVMLSTLKALPNTRLWERLKKEGRLLESATEVGTTAAGVRLNFVPSRPESEIINECVQAWDYLYQPSRFLARTYRYYLSMRPTRAAMGIQSNYPVSVANLQNNHNVREKLRDVLGFARLCWRQGIKYDCRGQYWRQLYGILRKNPSRFILYIIRLVMGEDMFRLRQSLRDEAADLGPQ
jgi:radical SAM superfamily enzyme YgiQ (UPF0313 family)